MANWNPELYAKFIKDRTQPSIDLVNRLSGLNPKTILDLGCGPGNSTKVLKDKFPNAKVIGADNSDEMLEKARQLYPEIEFIHLDASGDFHEVSGKFDIIFSNACIQWIPNHHSLLPKLMALLNPDGMLAVQIPVQAKLAVQNIIDELAVKWSGKINPVGFNDLTEEEYFDVLSEISKDFELWETTYCHRMPDYDSIIEWYKSTGLRPYLEQLSIEDAELFLGQVYNELKNRYSVQKNGEIIFRFPRLFFTARK